MGCCGCKFVSAEGAYRTNGLSSSFIERKIRTLDTNKTKVIEISLKRADNLPIGGAVINDTNAYVEMKLIPAETAVERSPDQCQLSTIQPTNLSPRWDPVEKFTFISTDVKLSKVLISTYHYSSNSIFQKPTPLGDAIIKVKDLDFKNTEENKEIAMISPVNGQAAGTVTLSISCKSLEEAAYSNEDYVWEFQRWNIAYVAEKVEGMAQSTQQWGSDRPDPKRGKAGHFLTVDPGRWCTYDGATFGWELKDIVHLKPGWEVVEDWYTMATEGDPEGWRYSANFNSPFWYPTNPSVAFGLQCYVRRRLWTRKVMTEEVYRDSSSSLADTVMSSGDGVGRDKIRASSGSTAGKIPLMETSVFKSRVTDSVTDSVTENPIRS